MCRTDSRLRKKQQDKRNDPVAQLLQQRVPIETIKRQAVTRGEGDKRYVNPSSLPSIIAQNSNQVDHGQLQGLSDDDHSQYHNDSRGDARYVKLSTLTTKGDIFARSSTAPTRVAVGSNGQVLTADSAATAGVSWQTPAASVTDHGALTGLADDDHSQYHNNTRGDARYYQKSEFSSNPITSSSIPLFTGSGGLLTLEKLYINSSAGDAAFGASVQMQVIDADIGISNDSGNPLFVGRSYDSFVAFRGQLAAGSRGSPSNVASDVEIVRLGGAAYGSGFPSTSMAYMSVFTTQAQTGSNKGHRLEFWTTDNGSSSATQKAMIDNNGNVALGGSHTPTSALDLVGTAIISADVRAGGGLRLGSTSGDAPDGAAVFERRTTTPATDSNAGTLYSDGDDFFFVDRSGNVRTISWT